MKAALYHCQEDIMVRNEHSDVFDEGLAQLALCFGAKEKLRKPGFYEMLRQRLPIAAIAICSTAGETYDTEVYDNSITVAILHFESTQIVAHSIEMKDYANSFEAGKSLRSMFSPQELAYMLVLSDGNQVNGSELVKGLNNYPEPLLITGGLAGDGSDFVSTVVGLNAPPAEGIIAGIGFYGSKITIGHGSQGGWEMFGLERKVTKSQGNILYEIEGKNALELYKKYLGPEANSLPGSALLFPLSVTLPETSEQVVRTILSIDEVSGSMTFAGDIPEGSQVRLMKANFDKLTLAASDAALQISQTGVASPKLALLISCVGRKLILKNRSEEEVEAVRAIFGNKTLITGFYSYGEISPIMKGEPCLLHNQTMTITTIDETE
jgi:hypothetical protein